MIRSHFGCRMGIVNTRTSLVGTVNGPPKPPATFLSSLHNAIPSSSRVSTSLKCDGLIFRDAEASKPPITGHFWRTSIETLRQCRSSTLSQRGVKSRLCSATHCDSPRSHRGHTTPKHDVIGRQIQNTDTIRIKYLIRDDTDGHAREHVQLPPPLWPNADFIVI
jgi:hypothetical protein